MKTQIVYQKASALASGTSRFLHFYAARTPMFRLLRALSPRYTLHKGMKRADMASRPRIPKSDPVRPNSPLGPRQTRHTRFAGAVRGGSWAQIPEDSYYKEIPHSPILWRFRTLPRRRCVFAPCVRMSRRNGDGVAPERRCRCAGTSNPSTLPLDTATRLRAHSPARRLARFPAWSTPPFPPRRKNTPLNASKYGIMAGYD